MGRRPKDDADKRKLIGARFDPDAFSFIEAAAKANGRSGGAEVEERVQATIGLDLESVRLLGQIAREIVAIQKLTGKRWHRDLKTWAAAKEMFKLGPLDERRPDRWDDDDEVNAAWERFRTLSDERRQIIQQFARIGITITEKPNPSPGGLFGATNALTLFGGKGEFDGGRSYARSTIEAAPDSKDKATALGLLDRLRELDVEIKDADDAWGELLMPYIEAEAEGRTLYQDRLKREAERKRDLGEPYNMAHLYGQFR